MQGKPYQRGHVIVYPIFLAQLPLFGDFDSEPIWQVADFRQRQEVLACNHKIDGSKFPSITNQTETPILFMPGAKITETQILNSSILVPGKMVIRVPDLCITSAHRLRRIFGSPVAPPVNSVGWIACGSQTWEMNLFGNQQACLMAGRRRLTLNANPGTDTHKSNVEAFAGMIHRLPWKRVRSAGLGAEWVASDRSVRSFALFLNRHLVHVQLTRYF